uniref:NADH-ubiquinone oxidoreductase chain 4L n=1 Tax=Habrobracon hebetor TaxID=69819 RepID=A0A7D5DSE8_9HYME|nr:NADH dehydrogenase subunit 4L [Habrobracon hebetor]
MMKIILILFFISIFMTIFFYKHILLNLISLEFLMINLFMNIYYTLNYLNMNFYFFNLFLTISICEGVMGLSILVYMMRNTGNDYSKILNLIKW